MSTTRPTEELYAETQSATPVQPENAQASGTAVRLAGIVAVAIATTLAGMKASQPTADLLPSFLPAPEDPDRAEVEKRHAEIVAGNPNFIKPLGALDYPDFHERKEKIYFTLAVMLYADLPTSVKRKGGMRIVEAELAAHETEVLWAWIRYVDGIKEYCRKESTPEKHLYFENVPGSIQQDIILAAAKQAGLYEVAQKALQENNPEEITRGVAHTYNPFAPTDTEKTPPVHAP